MRMVCVPSGATPLKVGRLSSVTPLCGMGLCAVLTSSSARTRSSGASGAVVSTVMRTGALDALSLPAASVAVSVRLCSPSDRPGAAGVRLHAPLGPTTTLARGVPLAYRVMMSPGVAPLPPKVGVVSSVTSPSLSGPCNSPTSSVMAPRVGVLGAVVSMVSAKVVLVAAPPLSPGWLAL